ncbi:MAG: hypothetical protein ACHQCH_03260 [Solirubrobacterales bacterium]
MISSEVQRTLVKSPPELWTELSDPDALARHLGELGEIRITCTDPEKAVEWEAADTTGKVMLAPSGWGTKVTLSVTREPTEVEPAAEPEPAVVDEPAPEPEPLAAEEALTEEHLEHQPRLGFFARLFRRRRQDQIDPEGLLIVEPETEIEPGQPALEDAPAEETQDIAAEPKAAEEAEMEQVTAVLTAVLDRLGAAHHRPFSRA